MVEKSALVIKKRALKLILDSGTELSDKGVLIPGYTERGARLSLGGRNLLAAMGVEASKMTELDSTT